MTVTLDDMKSKLLTVSQVYDALALTEPIHTHYLSTDSKNVFRVEDSWKDGIDTKDDFDLIPVYISLDGTERQLTKSGLLTAASMFGLTGAYLMSRIDNHVLEYLLNWHYSVGLRETEVNMVTANGNVTSFVRGSYEPFSTADILDQAINALQDVYGQGVELYADYKMANNLKRTDIRLIIPEAERVIRNGHMDDVPAGAQDQWCLGVALSNSMNGKALTRIESYFFRWWCTNGMIEEIGEIGRWNRRSDGSDGELLLEWVNSTVEDITGGMEERFDQIQRLTNVDVSAGRTGPVLKELFKDYSLPVPVKNGIQERLLASESLSMYNVLNAITAEANAESVNDEHADRIMRLGGSIPQTVFDIEKARIWEEGHRSPKTEKNPYYVEMPN